MMGTRRVATVLLSMSSLAFQQALSQGTSLAKSIDTTHQSVVAIHRIDPSGRLLIFSGVLIHPRVVLSAGHVLQTFPGLNNGFVNLGDAARDSSNRRPFDATADVDLHPDFERFRASLADTTGLNRPTMFLDIALLFLPKEIAQKPVVRLPKPSILARVTGNQRLVGVGYGFHRTVDSTFTPEFLDGTRRQWRLSGFSLVNESWLSTQCDPATNLPFISAGDSGGPLLVNDSVLVGIWSLTDADQGKDGCPYSSLAVRIDNPAVLSWINDRIRKRLRVDLR